MWSLPLEGVRVLDFTWVIAGPTITKWLAAHGAQVIKVESARDKTDAVRQDGGATAKGKAGGNVSGLFANSNTDKLGIALNMDQPAARAIARRLAAVSDVVLDNFTPGIMPRWGLDYESLRAINPQVICASMPGLGATGPHAHYRGHGSYFMARTGLDEMVGYPHRETVDVGFAFPDASCNPAHMMVAVLAALHHRNRTGQGQRIELRQFESTINYLATAMLDYSVNGWVQTRNGSRSADAAPQGVYRCAGDDRWCAITVASDEQWAGLTAAIGRPDLAADLRFAGFSGRKACEPEIDRIISGWTVSRDPYQVMGVLQRHGVAAGVVQHAGDLMDRDPQMAHRGFYVELEHPEIGPMRHESFSFRLSATPGHLRQPAPLLGQHTDHVLQEILGMAEPEVNQAIVAGAVL